MQITGGEDAHISRPPAELVSESNRLDGIYRIEYFQSHRQAPPSNLLVPELKQCDEGEYPLFTFKYPSNVLLNVF
jgi:hypothetical protein